MNDDVRNWAENQELDIQNSIRRIAYSAGKNQLSGDMALQHITLSAKYEILEHLILFLDELVSNDA